MIGLTLTSATMAPIDLSMDKLFVYVTVTYTKTYTWIILKSIAISIVSFSLSNNFFFVFYSILLCFNSGRNVRSACDGSNRSLQ